MSEYVSEVSDGTFHKVVLQSKLPVIVDFWAPWCGPCRSLAPTVEKFAEDLKGKAEFFKMNVDENRITPTKYDIEGIPTVILFRNGRENERAVGAVEAMRLLTSLLLS